MMCCRGAENVLARWQKKGRLRGEAKQALSWRRRAEQLRANRLAARLDYPTEGLRSKSWEEFSRPGAPVMDFVFTVCDDAAGEVCPVWPGHPMTAHWGIEDPSHVQGGDIERERAFVMALNYLENRIRLFISLPIDKLEATALTAKLREIGHTEGSTTRRGDAA